MRRMFSSLLIVAVAGLIAATACAEPPGRSHSIPRGTVDHRTEGYPIDYADGEKPMPYAERGTAWVRESFNDGNTGVGYRWAQYQLAQPTVLPELTNPVEVVAVNLDRAPLPTADRDHVITKSKPACNCPCGDDCQCPDCNCQSRADVQAVCHRNKNGGGGSGPAPEPDFPVGSYGMTYAVPQAGYASGWPTSGPTADGKCPCCGQTWNKPADPVRPPNFGGPQPVYYSAPVRFYAGGEGVGGSCDSSFGSRRSRR